MSQKESRVTLLRRHGPYANPRKTTTQCSHATVSVLEVFEFLFAHKGYGPSVKHWLAGGTVLCCQTLMRNSKHLSSVWTDSLKSTLRTNHISAESLWETEVQLQYSNFVTLPHSTLQTKLYAFLDTRHRVSLPWRFSLQL